MVRSIDRRSFLAAGATAGVVTIAGCGQDSGATESENTEAGTDETDTTDGNNGSTGTEEMTAEGTTCEASNDGTDDASFDLDVVVDKLPDAFESLSAEFTGFKLSDVDGCTVTRESDPVQLDLAELASDRVMMEDMETMDLMETTVPAGEYDSITYFLTVTDTTTSSGDGEQTFRSDEDGEVPGVLAEPGENSLDIEAGESITITPELYVQEWINYDWSMGSRFDTRESIDRQS